MKNGWPPCSAARPGAAWRRRTCRRNKPWIEEAAGGPYGPRRSVARDKGAFTVTCYTPEGRPVLITEDGDWQQENRSPAALELRAWLETLDPRFKIR